MPRRYTGQETSSNETEVGALIKLFASDLDGTLFNALHEVDRGILSAIDRTLRAGRHVALATGRFVRTASELGFGPLPIEVVCANGAFVIDARGGLLRQVPIDPATLEELLRDFPAICPICVAFDGTYVRGTREEHSAGYLAPKGLLGPLIVRRMRRSLRTPDHLYDQTDADILGAGICKVNCRVLDEGLKAEVAAFVEEHASTIVNASFDGDLFEITDASVNKGEAVSWLAGHYGISEDEVAVYGDGGNDIAMLERFEHAYATRNGSDEAKRAAGRVIGHNALHAVPRHFVRTVRREGPLPR